MIEREREEREEEPEASPCHTVSSDSDCRLNLVFVSMPLDRQMEPRDRLFSNANNNSKQSIIIIIKSIVYTPT